MGKNNNACAEPVVQPNSGAPPEGGVPPCHSGSMHKNLVNISWWARFASQCGAAVCSAIVVTMVIATIVDTVCRYVFNNPIPGVIEYNEVMFPIFVFLGLGYTQQVDGHLKVSFFLDRLSFSKRRRLVIGGLILSMLVAGVAGYRTWLSAMYSHAIQEEYWAVIDGSILYVWPAKFAVSIGFWMLFLQCFAQLTDTLWTERSDNRIQEVSND